jgi:hypothetical protein
MMARASLKPVKTEQHEIDDTPEWDDYRDKLGNMFGRMVQQRAELHAKKKELEESIKEWDEQILAAMKKIPAESVLVNGIRATYVERVTQTVDKGALASNLLKLGLDAAVAQQTITDSCKESRSEFVKITAPRMV